MKLRTLALGSAASIALLAGSAFAADLPVRSAAPAPVVYAPVFTWTGFYVGLNAGIVNSNVELFRGFDVDSNAGTIGVRGGYDAQFGSFVIGALVDLDYSNMSFQPFIGGPSVDARFILGANLRLGFLVTPATLVYATGGYTYADVDTGVFNFGSHADGWNVGLGVEHRFTANWSGFVEYRYHQLDVNVPAGASGDVEAHTVKVGVNYRFGGAAAPVVARY